MASPEVFDEDSLSLVHHAAIADLALTTPTANETAVQNAVNAILDALRSANVVAGD